MSVILPTKKANSLGYPIAYNKMQPLLNNNHLCPPRFCKNCFRLAVRAQGPHCPLCRGPVSETEKRAIDVQQQMRERKGQCRACGTTVADTIYYTLFIMSLNVYT